MKTALSIICASALPCVLVFAETVKDREGAVRKDRETMEKDARWIFNDLDKGFAEAKKSGKPLLVALRCVPCLSCMGLDVSVLTESGLQPLLDQFVCVRLINANAVDLSLFQFDYDLSFSTLFMNADKTIYGRYGSWTHQRDSKDSSTAGYKAALEAALALHRGYPGNKADLAAKQGGPAPFKTPVEIPTLAGKYGRELNWTGNVVQSCVHCHQIGDGFRAYYRDQKKPMPVELIYPMPPPDAIGLRLDPAHRAKVAEVTAHSPAEAAGLKAGDEITAIAGQPPVSIADVAWALHRSPESGPLKVRVNRAGETKSDELTVSLPKDWRLKTDISTRVGTWPMRAMAFGGMVLVDLTDEERKQRALPTDAMALLAKHVGQYGAHAAAKNAGFKQGDVLTEIDGNSKRITESALIGRMLLTRHAGEKVKTRLLRGDQSLELTMPIQ